MSERDWLKYFLAKRNMGAVICEGPEIEAACAEIDRLHSDYSALLDRHNELRESVAWERECDGMLWPIYDTDAYFEVYNTKVAARAEVDRLVGKGEP